MLFRLPVYFSPVYYPLFFIKYDSEYFSMFFKPLLREKYFLVEILWNFTRQIPRTSGINFCDYYMLYVFSWRAQEHLYFYLVYVAPSTKMWNVQVCVIYRLIFESACWRMDWFFFWQESDCFDLSVPRLRFLIHSRIKAQTRVHQPKSRRWRWRRKAEKQNRICMHRSVPEYKQRIIRGHKVTVSCYVAWRRVRVRGARGMKVWMWW